MAYRYKVQTAERKDDILLLTLAPKRRRALSFEPGQYAAIGFIQAGRPTPMRCFSIVSTPGSGLLQFAMCVRGNFTQTAATLQSGDTVRVQGPFGDFTINSDYDRRIVMLASGIGITPSLSIIRDLTERRIALPITLWFSNHSSASVPFKAQLQTLAERNPYLNIRFFAGDTTGRVTDQHIRQLVDDNGGGATYFICGSKNFTTLTQSALRRENVDESRILTESFAQSLPVAADSGWSVRSLTYAFAAVAMLVATGAIMALDLSRYVPKLAAAEATPTSHTVNSTSATTSTAGSSASTGTAANSGNSNTAATSTVPPPSTPATTTAPSPAPTQTNNNSSNYTTYQPPVSSVS